MSVQHTTAAHAAPAASSVDGARVLRRVALRIIPILSIGYCLAYMDRINVSFASLRMNADLHFSATVYGTGAGLFFVGYALCEVPSNLLLLRFGARRWLARIMLTWGLLAAAMMFVRTPTQVYVLRFLLGVAEAGFFPGVIFYLTLWFPAHIRARAISRFYIALPLSSVVMGSLAGLLLGLSGTWGLAGWQWLFLVEGLPAALYSFVLFSMLPDNPASAKWLTSQERAWLQAQLDADSGSAHLSHKDGVLRAMLSPYVWLIGAFFFLQLTCNYALGFSLPAILQEATGWSVTRVGFLVAALGVLGALAMLLGGISSDRKRERALHCIVPCTIIACAYIVSSMGKPGWLVAGAVAFAFVLDKAVQGPALAVPTEFMAGRACAAGIATMNTITMFSGFVGPYWMGVTRDATGNYWLGLRGLAVPSLLAAVAMAVLTRSLARSKPRLHEDALAGKPA